MLSKRGEPVAREGELFEPVAKARGGQAVALKSTPELLGDAAQYANAGVVVWGPGKLEHTPPANLTPEFQKLTIDFVKSGGDLVIFEQWGAKNTKVLDTMFGVVVAGYIAKGPTIEYAPLKDRLHKKGVTDQDLQGFSYYNTYTGFPKDAIVLLKGNGGTAAVVAPFGKGRLILLGLHLKAPEAHFIDGIIELLYPTRDSPK